MNAEPKEMVRVGGVDFDLAAAPHDLQRKWLVTKAAFDIAKGPRAQAELHEQLKAIGKEIAASLAVNKLLQHAPRAYGAAGLWGKLHS